VFTFAALVAVIGSACSVGGRDASSGRAKSVPPPLHLPALAAGDRCPISQPHQLSPAFGPGLGTGPAYPVGIANGVLRFEYPPSPTNTMFGDSDWGGQKVLWVVDPSYHGAVLIRGGRLDGTESVRFGSGRTPAQQLRLAAEPGNTTGGWLNYPSYTRLRAAGCYAYQIDGRSFSNVIVFRAAVIRPQ
jgi:hypothetical protein